MNDGDFPENVFEMKAIALLPFPSHKTAEKAKGETVMKTKAELNALKEDIKAIIEKLAELSDDELAQVSGGKPSGMSNEDYWLRMGWNPVRDDAVPVEAGSACPRCSGVIQAFYNPENPTQILWWRCADSNCKYTYHNHCFNISDPGTE